MNNYTVSFKNAKSSASSSSTQGNRNVRAANKTEAKEKIKELYPHSVTITGVKKSH